MSTNRDLLKEAIADAKAVKETAIANAKAALEEAFTPQIKSMLAAQILAEEEEEDDLAEADKVRMEMDEMEEGYGVDDTNEAEEIDEEFDLEEILAELELEEETSEPHGNIGANTPEGEPLGFLEEEINLDELDEDELKALIEDVIEDMIESGELEAGGDPVEFSDEEEEEEEEGGEEMDIEMDAEEEIEEGIKNVVKGIFTSDTAKFLAKVKEKGLEDELKNNLKGAPQNNTFQSIVTKDLGMDGLSRGQVANIISRAIEQKYGKAVGGAMATAGGPGESGRSNIGERKLQEALKTIKSLQKELNEVNLLNSKLLYVNKIFRNKNLTESQKVKVLSAFDKATSVKESKIIYETLNEGLVSKTTTTKSSIRESLGMASKPAGVAPKQPIVESDQMVKRFQKLAGIL